MDSVKSSRKDESHKPSAESGIKGSHKGSGKEPQGPSVDSSGKGSPKGSGKTVKEGI